MHGRKEADNSNIAFSLPHSKCKHVYECWLHIFSYIGYWLFLLTVFDIISAATSEVWLVTPGHVAVMYSTPLPMSLNQ